LRTVGLRTLMTIMRRMLRMRARRRRGVRMLKWRRRGMKVLVIS